MSNRRDIESVLRERVEAAEAAQEILSQENVLLRAQAYLNYQRGYANGLAAGRAQSIKWLEHGWPEHKVLADALTEYLSVLP